MEVYEVINTLLKNRGMTKREFARQLIAHAPKLKNTGETPSEQVIYHYLSGRLSLKVELIPYIADILGVSEQELFDWSEKRRIAILQSILKDPSAKELSTIKYMLSVNNVINETNNPDDENSNTINEDADEILKLIKYAPPQFISLVKGKLYQYKKIYDDF